jgi:hypothetical protein
MNQFDQHAMLSHPFMTHRRCVISAALQTHLPAGVTTLAGGVLHVPGKLEVSGVVTATADTHAFGLSTGTAQNLGIGFYNTSATTTFTFQSFLTDGTGASNDGYISFLRGSGAAINGLTQVAFAVGGTAVAGATANGFGYITGAGGAVTQATSRTTGVTLNKACGSITLVSAAGSTSYQSFTVTNSCVAATDTIRVNQKSGTDKYAIFVTAIGAGSFQITYATLSGTTTEQPVFNFSVMKAVVS